MKDFIKYVQYSQGATSAEAVDLWEDIQNQLADGKTIISVLENLDLPLDLADFF